MQDAAALLLKQAATDLNPRADAPGGEQLWLAAENFSLAASDPLFARSKPRLITNRYDIFTAFAQTGIACVCNDFDLGVIESAIEAVFIRISKEKALTHYLINQAYLALPMGGHLAISGYKDEGIKTYAKKAAALLGQIADQRRGDKQAGLIVLQKTSNAQALLDDKNYPALRNIAELKGQALLSKPGVFGWRKIDVGSQLLTDYVPTLLPQIETPIKNILDLGCGYGYIAVQTFQQNPSLQQATFILTDNNASAILCANQNLKQHGLIGRALCDDCGSQLASQSFELILCNPPFHIGFEHSQAISQRFLDAIERLLKPQGVALLVVNQFIPLERLAAARFSDIKTPLNNQSFKLVVLRR